MLIPFEQLNQETRDRASLSLAWPTSRHPKTEYRPALAGRSALQGGGGWEESKSRAWLPNMRIAMLAT